MSFFEIFQTRKFFIEILSQIKNFLWNIKNLVFPHFANSDKSCYDICVNQIFFLELLANLQRYINSADRQKRWMSYRKIQIMHRHFSQVNSHFLNKILLHLLLFFFRASLIYKWDCRLFQLNLILRDVLILLVSLSSLIRLFTWILSDLNSVCA